MDKQYIEDQYHQAMLEFKTAINEESQWEARKIMARLEALAIEMFGTDFQEELRRKELGEPDKNPESRVPRRYRQGADGQMHRSWNGKLPEEFGEQDALAFLADTDLQLTGTISQDTLAALDQAGYTYQDGTVQPKSIPKEQPIASSRINAAAEFVEKYAGEIEKQTEDCKNFLIEDNSIFPFEVRDGYHAAVRYAYVGRGDMFEDIKDAESEVKMNITAVIYKDGTLNEYDQGIVERKFTLTGVKAIDEFCEKLEQSVRDSIMAHPDMQPVVTVNYSEYDNYNPLVGDHMRLSLDRANSLFELIDIVARRDVGEKGSRVYYKTSADIMYIHNGKTGHFDLSQDFGKNDGSIIKQIEGYIEGQIEDLGRHSEQPDAENRIRQWETTKKELIPYFDRHISLSRAERDLEYMGKAASVMQDNIFEMRAFLNTGTIVSAPEKNQPEQAQREHEQENDFSRQIDDVLAGIVKVSPTSLQKNIAVDNGKVYLSLPRVSKEKFPVLIQELKQKGAKFDAGQKQWYVDENAAKSGGFNAYIRTYLTLPSMGKEKFDLTVQQLKQDGAHFDTVQKRWYIDGNCDQSRFQAYLTPKSQIRLSVLGKLQSASETAAGTEDSTKGIKLHQHENTIQ